MKKFSVCNPYLCGNETEYVMEAMRTGWISSSGSYVNKFENAFSEYCDCKYGIAVSNGTVAIHLALVALGITMGDEVIIPSFTMIATAYAVCYTGAVPVFVDADPLTWNIDVNKIEDKITDKTKAIIPVHIFGNPCNMDGIRKLADKYNLFIIEDAAESHGAEYKGKKVGSFSDIAAFSFFANKNITTGEGGMCVTNDEKLKDLCHYYKNMCFSVNGPRDYSHDNIGFNYRMSNLHAAIGLAQTEKAEFLKNKRIEHHQMYKNYLENCPGVIFQKDEDYSLNVCWMNAIVIDRDLYGYSKDELVAHLNENGVDTRMLFKGMHRQKCLKEYGCDCSGEFDVTDWLSQNGFYLPSGSDLKQEDIEYISKIIIHFRNLK